MARSAFDGGGRCRDRTSLAPPSSTTRRWVFVNDCATQAEAARQLTWHAASL
jgi:hypothetical protein